MTRLADIILSSPLRPGWLHAALLLAFALHFLFVTLTLGTALLASAYYVAAHVGGNPAVRGWDTEFLGSFFAHKSLAIVLGVGPILLMQVGHSIPFLTGVNVVAPLWMAIGLCLIVSLALYEWQHRRKHERRWYFLVVTAAALAFLLYVPATFVSVLSSAERPRLWPTMVKLGGQLPLGLAVHGGLRLLHVLGAAVVVTAGFHYVLQPKTAELKRRHLLAWIVGGLAFQWVDGVALFGSVRPYPSALATAITLVGVVASVVLALVVMPWRRVGGPRPLAVAVLIPLVLLPMLLGRQVLQDRILYPFGQALRKNAVEHQAKLAPFRGPAVAAFRASLATPYDNGLAIYTRSCAFCHGAVGNGSGDDRGGLDVPPEDLTRTRMGEAKLTYILRNGMDGSAMPRFDYYIESELALVRRFLRERVGLRQEAETLPRRPAERDQRQASELFTSTCSVCHGKDGRGSDIGLQMRPPTPSFTQQSLAPSRAFEVITNGYPGTLMRPFGDLPPDVRFALVAQVQSFYGGGAGQPEPFDAAVADAVGDGEGR